MTDKTNAASVRFALGPGRFILLFTAFTLLAYNGPMFARAAGFLQDAAPGRRLMLFGMLAMVVVFLQVVIFGLLALVSIRLTRLVAALSMVLNAAALYFIVTYGVGINLNVVRSIFATDTATTVNLLHPALFLTVLLLGVLPALGLWRLPVVRSPRRRLLALIAAAFASFALGNYLVAGRWPWDGWHASETGALVSSEVGAMALPWGYVGNTVIFLQEDVLVRRDLQPLPDGRFSRAPGPGEKQVVVLLIGESARAANHAQYGYGRETDPYTRDLGLVALPGARACDTYTLAGLACILSHRGDKAGIHEPWEPLPSYLQRQGVEVLWRTNSSGQPPLKVAQYQRLDELREGCAIPLCDAPRSESALLAGLAERIAAAPSGRVLVVLHQGRGSHGPAYYDQYEPRFARFRPTCETVRVQSCTHEALVNTYDNTIVQTDWLLARTIDLLKGLAGAETVLLYVSDHGESLGETGPDGYPLYQHATPIDRAPREQVEIPFLVWMSPEFQAAHGIGDPLDIARGGPFGHGNVFHSVLGAFGFTSPVYRPELDIFAAAAGQ